MQPLGWWSQVGTGVLIVVIDILVIWLFFALAAKGPCRFMRDEAGQRVLNRIFRSLFVAVAVAVAVAVGVLPARVE